MWLADQRHRPGRMKDTGDDAYKGWTMHRSWSDPAAALQAWACHPVAQHGLH